MRYAGWGHVNRVVEVEGPGLVPQNVAAMPLQRLPRPIFPLDEI